MTKKELLAKIKYEIENNSHGFGSDFTIINNEPCYVYSVYCKKYKSEIVRTRLLRNDTKKELLDAYECLTQF